MRIKKGLAVAVSAAAVIGLAACSSGGAGSTDSGKTSITWDMWAGSDSDIAAAEEMVKIAQEQNPDIDIKLTTSPWSDYFTKLTANLSSGNVACVTSMNGQRLSGYASAFSPLTDEDLETAGIDAEAFGDAAMSIMEYDGKQLGVSYDVASMLVYYNADLFAEAGVELPTNDWTFEDFEAAAVAITENTDKYGFAVSPAEFQWASLPIAMAGKQFVADDGTLQLDDKDIIDAATWYGDLVTKAGVAAPVPSASDGGWGETEYAAGNVGMAVDGTWNATSYINNEAGFTAGAVRLPIADDTPYSLVLGSGYGISADCENREAALKVLGSLVSAEAQDAISSSGRSYPALIESRDLYFESLEEDVAGPLAETFAASFEGATGQITTDKWTQISESFPQYLVSVYNGQATMADTLSQMQQQFGK